MVRVLIAFVLSLTVSANAWAGNWNSSENSQLTSFSDIKLECETTDYRNSGYSVAWGQSWIPQKHAAIISQGVVKSLTTGATGRVTRDNDKRIEFIFDETMDERADQGRVKGIYFKTNGKLMTKVDFGANYIASGPIWGKCKEVNFLPATQSKQNNDENIRKAIRGLMVADPEVQAENFSISVDKGVVTISGMAKSEDEKQRVIKYTTIPSLPVVSVTSFVEVTVPNVTSTIPSKLDKAKSTCTELGFTLGTEKHGECVLKVMDN